MSRICSAAVFGFGAGAGFGASGFLAAALFLEKLFAEPLEELLEEFFSAFFGEFLEEFLAALFDELLDELLPFAAPGFLPAEVLPAAGRLAVRVDFARG